MSGGGNPSARAAAGSPDCPMVGGGGGHEELSGPRHGQPGLYQSNGGGGGSEQLPDPRHASVVRYGSNGGSGGAGGPFTRQHVGSTSSWYAGSGESSGGGSGIITGASFNLHNGYASYGTADRHRIAGDWRASGMIMSRGSASYGGGEVSYSNGGKSAADWSRVPGYGTGYYFYENGGGSGSAPSPLRHVDAAVYPPQPSWSGGGSNSVVDRCFENSSSFPLPPRVPTGPYEPQHARAYYWHAGVGGGTANNQRFDVFHGNGHGRDRALLPPPRAGGALMHMPHYYAPDGRLSRAPRERCVGHLNDLASNFQSLTIRDDHGRDSLVNRRVSDGLLNHRQALPNTGGGYHSGRLRNADPYAGMRLQDFRGSMGRVATDHRGCRFLVRMVDGGGAAAARQVLDEVAGEVVRLMGDDVGHALVEKLADFWTDEETVARVVGALAAAPPVLILAAARNHAGSRILQRLMDRVAGEPEQVESLTSTLAGVGEPGVLSLMEDMSGSQLLLKCLDRFTADQNQFITDVVLRFPRRICVNRHGCHVFIRCIDKVGDEQRRDSLIYEVCEYGLQLAEDGAGNYVVQHVIEYVPGAPWAKDSLHLAFQKQYVSLSRQKSGSHVVQRCLQFFSGKQAEDIVFELLTCKPQCDFGELISDPFANYVLQTAMEHTEGELRKELICSIDLYRHILRTDRFAKQVFQKLYKFMPY